MLIHNSHQRFFRTPAGPAPAGKEVTIRLLCDEAASVRLRTWDGKEHFTPMTFAGAPLWTVTVKMPRKPGLFWYDFELEARDGHILR